MEDIMCELAEKWAVSEVVDAIEVGDIFITRSGENAYIVGKCGMHEEVSDKVRVYQRAPVTVPEGVFGIIAEYKDDPDYGRYFFQQSPWAVNIWTNSQDTTDCNIDELTNIVPVMDSKEYL